MDEKTGRKIMHALVPVAQALRFMSRLPVPALPGETNPHAPPDFACQTWAVPLAGLVIGSLGGLTLWTATGILLLPALPASVLAVAMLVAVTGAMHEDGLADSADGLFGAMTAQGRLEIMSDSRIGAFGAAALVLALLLRVSLLTSLVEAFGPEAAGLLIAAAVVSRACALLPLWRLPPAKASGRGASVGRPGGVQMLPCAIITVGLVLLTAGPIVGSGRAVAACLVAGLAIWPLMVLARKRLGGQTGDLAGAAQQLSELGCLLTLSIGLAA